MNETDGKLLLDDLAEIVAIPSVYSTPAAGAPYGGACARALEWFVAKARSYGLRAENIDNYCAYAEYGEGKECVGVLAHLDVVPAGNGWSTPPFKMIEENGKVYGRGVGDDKGSVVVCLHALKELKDSGAKLNCRVRLIVGADEERGSSCIRHYLETGGEVPAMSFVPDSEFPVINSEKGISHMRLVFKDPALADSITALTGAECYNAVPDRSTVTLKAGGPLETALKKAGDGKITLDSIIKHPFAKTFATCSGRVADFEVLVGSKTVVAVSGIAEHASTPDKGDNALAKMLAFLASGAKVMGCETDCFDRIAEYLCYPNESADKLGIYVDDKKSGNLTMCMSHAEFCADESALKIVIDFRLPLGVKLDDVAKKLEEKLGCGVEILDYHENLYIDEDTPLIQKLLGVYRKITGDNSAPIQTGGGTYARELPNAVAFGCTPLGLDINMHKADENFPVAQLFKNYEIYLAAMKELAK